MPRPDPLVRNFGQVDFNSIIPFDADLGAPPLGVNDLLVMRRALGGDNVLVTVGDIQAHGGAVGIADLTGGVDTDMLYKVGGIWTGTSPSGLSYDGSIFTVPPGSAAAPGLQIGSGAANGFYRPVAGAISVALLGIQKWSFQADQFNFAGTLGGAIRGGTGSTTVPNLIPIGSDSATGIGADGAGTLALIASNVPGQKLFKQGAGVITSYETSEAITAFAGGGQGGAIALVNGYNVLSVVATAGDSVKLPAAFFKGAVVYVKNNGANAADIFPATGDNLGAGVNTAVSIAAGKARAFLATAVSSVWTELLPSSAAFPIYQFEATDFLNPNNADWDVNALAPSVADSNNAAINVRLFDDTIIEGVGAQFFIPAGASNIVFKFMGRAETAPGAAAVVRMALEVREIPDNAAVAGPPWTTFALAEFDIPTNENFQNDSQTVGVAALGLAAGELIQIEFTRVAAIVGTDLVGDYALAQIEVTFT